MLILSQINQAFLNLKGEAKRELSGNAISVNKEKVNDTFEVSEKDLIDGKFLLLQKGKKSYFIVKLYSLQIILITMSHLFRMAFFI